MSYIIVWNPNSTDNQIHTDYHGFIEHYDDRDEAIDEAERCIDGQHFRSFMLYEEDIYKIK